MKTIAGLSTIASARPRARHGPTRSAAKALLALFTGAAPVAFGLPSAQAGAPIPAMTDFAHAKGAYFLQLALVGPFSVSLSIYGVLNLTAGGAYSLRCFAPKPVAVTGQFDRNGNSVWDRDEVHGALHLSFQNGMGEISGSTEAPGDYFSSMSGAKMTPGGPFTGRYTALLGRGWTTINVTSGGLIAGVGQDFVGLPFTTVGALLSPSTFSLYSPELYSAYGGPNPPAYIGSATFRNIPGVSDFDGAFENAPAIGSRFIPPAPGQRLLRFSQPNGAAKVAFETVLGAAAISVGADDHVYPLASPLRSFQFSTASAAMHGRAAFETSSGQFSGRFLDLVPTASQSWSQGYYAGFGDDAEINVSATIPPGYAHTNDFFGSSVVLATSPDAPGAPIVNPVTNPSFELPLSEGWTVATSGPSASVQETDQGTDTYPSQGAQYVDLERQCSRPKRLQRRAVEHDPRGGPPKRHQAPRESSNLRSDSDTGSP